MDFAVTENGGLMMRLIDADSLKRTINNQYIISDTINQAIDDAATITPESLVVHGKWEQSRIPCERFCCSICGGAAWYYDVNKIVEKSRCCPNCGARMDLEK